MLNNSLLTDSSHSSRSTNVEVVVDDVSVSLSGNEILKGVSMTALAGRTLSILGPSGCGKTTLLRTLAGLYRIDSGAISLGSEVVASDGLHVPADKRGVGMVFQDWALFPHLTVTENIAFGLPRTERQNRWFKQKSASPRVTDLLDLLEIAKLADCLPASLSGGQCQRVALARALAPQPSVLLLDEPFSNLDAAMRVEIRADLALLLRELGITCVFVTHDQNEAFALGSDVAVMRNGTVVQQDPPNVIYEHPADRWVAGFVGDAAIIPGTASGRVAQTSLGKIPLSRSASGMVDVLVRPEQLALRKGTTTIVDHLEYYGHNTLYYIRVGCGTMLRCRASGAPRFAVGSCVDIQHNGTRTVAFQPHEQAATPNTEQNQATANRVIKTDEQPNRNQKPEIVSLIARLKKYRPPRAAY